MGIDWETLLDTDGEDLVDAYTDYVEDDYFDYSWEGINAWRNDHGMCDYDTCVYSATSASNFEEKMGKKDMKARYKEQCENKIYMKRKDETVKKIVIQCLFESEIFHQKSNRDMFILQQSGNYEYFIPYEYVICRGDEMLLGIVMYDSQVEEKPSESDDKIPCISIDLHYIKMDLKQDEGLVFVYREMLYTRSAPLYREMMTTALQKRLEELRQEPWKCDVMQDMHRLPFLKCDGYDEDKVVDILRKQRILKPKQDDWYYGDPSYYNEPSYYRKPSSYGELSDYAELYGWRKAYNLEWNQTYNENGEEEQNLTYCSMTEQFYLTDMALDGLIHMLKDLERELKEKKNAMSTSGLIDFETRLQRAKQGKLSKLESKACIEEFIHMKMHELYYDIPVELINENNFVNLSDNQFLEMTYGEFAVFISGCNLGEDHRRILMNYLCDAILDEGDKIYDEY